jgi:hypothetical protein
MNKLTPLQKKAIADRIAKLDPKGKLVTLTPNAAFSGGSIAYNRDSGITLQFRYGFQAAEG